MNPQTFAQLKPLFAHLQDRTVANSADFTRLLQILIDHKEADSNQSADLSYENYYIKAISANLTELSDLLDKLEGLEAHRVQD